MCSRSDESVTILLERACLGDRSASDRLFRIVQRELKGIAENYMRTERPNHSLQPTILVHDAFLRLVGKTDLNFQDRTHFFRTAAKAMRQLLVDHERARRAQRRGGDFQQVELNTNIAAVSGQELDLLALNEALLKLAEIDPRQAEIVELHHYGGFSLKETAEIIGVSVGTVKSDWRLAKAWLRREITRMD